MQQLFSGVKEHTIVHTYIYIHTCSKKKRTKDVGDSDLIPFEDHPVFGITPASDQYYENQAFDWRESTMNFGEDTFDEHSFDEHMFDSV